MPCPCYTIWYNMPCAMRSVHYDLCVRYAFRTPCPLYTMSSVYTIYLYTVPPVHRALCTPCPLYTMRCVQHALCLYTVPSEHHAACTPCTLDTIPSVHHALYTPCPLYTMSSVQQSICTQCPLYTIPSVHHALCTSCPLCTMRAACGTRCTSPLAVRSARHGSCLPGPRRSPTPTRGGGGGHEHRGADGRRDLLPTRSGRLLVHHRPDGTRALPSSAAHPIPLTRPRRARLLRHNEPGAGRRRGADHRVDETVRWQRTRRSVAPWYERLLYSLTSLLAVVNWSSFLGTTGTYFRRRRAIRACHNITFVKNDLYVTFRRGEEGQRRFYKSVTQSRGDPFRDGVVTSKMWMNYHWKAVSSIEWSHR